MTTLCQTSRNVSRCVYGHRRKAMGIGWRCGEGGLSASAPIGTGGRTASRHGAALDSGMAVSGDSESVSGEV